MIDVVSPAVRSRMMAGIRGANTRPEIMLRRALHAHGYRYVLHDRRLPGKPDIVFPKYSAVIHAQGCFWHGHDCQLFKWPSSRPDFWRAKIGRNREVDQRNESALAELGWRQAIVWECALKGRARLEFADVIRRCDVWLQSSKRRLEIRGAA